MFCTLHLLHVNDGTRLEIPVTRFPLQVDQIYQEIAVLNESSERDRFDLLTKLISMLERWKSECLAWRQTRNLHRGIKNMSEQIRIHCSILKERKVQTIRTAMLVFGNGNISET